MGKPKVLGLMVCPWCMFEDSEIRSDRNGHPYHYCPDCSQPAYSHGQPVRVRNMLARIRPGTAPAADPPAAPPAPAPDRKPSPPASSKPATTPKPRSSWDLY